MRRWLIGMVAAFVTIVATIAPGLAANLPSSSQSLAGANVAVASCDTDGVTVVRTLSGANVVSVTISNIASACGNGALSMTLSNGSTSVSATAVVPAGGGSVVVTPATPIAATNAMTTHLTIVGA
ncbi:MAG TPA: hypothetical protein VI193_04930 [Acidimicrobiia bacterium]